jgi:nucleotidyltransferase AbiEii toxin of type IV toxin-antitoxin system
VTTDAYRQVIVASPRDRLDLFLAAANRLGAPIGNVEKDFWVCWTLNTLYHRLPANRPRLLFKGGTSLSKAYDLIQRFSEDIDITLFREDLGQNATIEDFQALSNKQRRRRLDAIRDACRGYITGPLKDDLTAALVEDTGGLGHVDVDADDSDGQTLLVWYPEVEPRYGAYVRPAVRIESGGKSALDPHRDVVIRPYIAQEIPDLDLAVPEVTTIDPSRTFWDKVVIVHGLRRWYERRGVLRQEGQRVSRHYYDLHCLMTSDIGQAALANPDLAVDCVRHARMFFDRPDYDLASAVAGSFAIIPLGGMIDALRRDYSNTAAMIFGSPPTFDELLVSVTALDASANRSK